MQTLLKDADVVSSTWRRWSQDHDSGAVGGERAAVLSERERRIAVALAEAVLPSGGKLPGGGSETVERLERFAREGGRELVRAVRASLWIAESATLPLCGRPLSSLSIDERSAVLTAWSESASRHARWLLRAIVTPLKVAHFDDARLYARVGCRYTLEPPAATELQRWKQRMIDGRQLDEELELECEVVVVGTGAGGAAAAYELATRGRAVLMLEWGGYYERKDFRARSTEAHRKLYLGHAATIALGNVMAPVWAGRAVGGTTVINSGTCYRAPEWTLERWAQRYGLTMFSADKIAPYYERVEAMLRVEPAAAAHLGGTARVIARGASALGLSHGPLRRNAPDCDGQGVCCFGCPTGAKRSTDVSYVPAALERGAQLISGAYVERVDIEAGRARGVTGRLASGRSFRVRADAVVVAGGALLTPLLLRRSGACRTSGWLGKNLSVHPVSKVMALFDEVIDMSRGIPQSYAIEEYARDGIMFEGGSTPLEVTALAIPWIGRKFMEVIERYPQIATFGFMLQDTSRGEVRPGRHGLPLILYNLNRRDTRRIQRGIETLSEVFLRAGAKRVLPLVTGCEEIQSHADLQTLRGLELRPGDSEVTAFHPLGTCRLGTDPGRSCVGPDGEAHDTEALFVADGSAIPSSLGVNPQLTIMAIALRTAEAVDDQLDGRGRGTNNGRVAPDAVASAMAGAARPGAFEFRETMQGSWRPLEGSAGRDKKTFAVTIHAVSPSWTEFARRREVRITGRVYAEGLAEGRGLEGTLGLDLVRTGSLPYSFEFTGEDGTIYRFSGQKLFRASAPLHSMTWLPGGIHDATGRKIGDAELRFDARHDLIRFLRSWKLMRGI